MFQTMIQGVLLRQQICLGSVDLSMIPFKKFQRAYESLSDIQVQLLQLEQVYKYFLNKSLEISCEEDDYYVYCTAHELNKFINRFELLEKFKEKNPLRRITEENTNKGVMDAFDRKQIPSFMRYYYALDDREFPLTYDLVRSLLIDICNAIYDELREEFESIDELIKETNLANKMIENSLKAL